VERVLATDLSLETLIKPTYSIGHDSRRKRVCSIVHEPSIRANLLARLPHSLLFGRRGELTTAPNRTRTTASATTTAAVLQSSSEQHRRAQT
jgi:hypothetical protein